MYHYTLTQWILFFFCYCFSGWIWECSYVSIKEGIEKKYFRFINRGFLHGPVIPIYGFAAVSILLSTVKIKENLFAVYFMGALTATLFELVTGFTMEKLFRVKYWDYSEFPLNYKGHICLFVSMFWGFVSVFLVAVIHTPIENIVIHIVPFISELIAFILVAMFAYDFHSSVNEALNLKNILEAISRNNADVIRRLERRIDATMAFSPIFDKTEALKLLKRNPTVVSSGYKEAMEQLQNIVKK